MNELASSGIGSQVHISFVSPAFFGDEKYVDIFHGAEEYYKNTSACRYILD